METKIDELGALSAIPPMVFLVCDIWAFYHYKIGEVGDDELWEVYEKLCVDGKLKEVEGRT